MFLEMFMKTAAIGNDQPLLQPQILDVQPEVYQKHYSITNILLILPIYLSPNQEYI